MKLVFLLLVCVASSYALELGPLNNVAVQVEQHLQTVLQNYKQQLLNLIQAQKPQFESVLQLVNEFIGKLPVLQQVYAQKIKDKLVQFVQSVLNGNSRTVSFGQLQLQLQSILQELTAHLQSLALNVIAQVTPKRVGGSDYMNLFNNMFNFDNLVNDISSSLLNSLNNLLGNIIGKRDLGNVVANVLGLGQVWDSIQQAGGNIMAQLTSAATQMLFAGQAVLAQAKVILDQLVKDIQSHAGNSLPIIQTAVGQLTNLLQQSTGKRAVGDFVLNALGFGQVVDQLQAAGSNLYNQLISVGTQFLFSGQQLLAQAKPIFAQLLKDLQNHVANAGPLVQAALAQLTQVLSSSAGGKRDVSDFLFNSLGLGQVVSQLHSLSQGLYSQLVSTATTLFFAGQQVLAQAKPILLQLVKDLKEHALNASPYVQTAVASLQQVLLNAVTQSGKRNLQDVIFNALGINSIVSELQNLGTSVMGQFTSALTQLFFSGQVVLAQGQQILNNLIKDLQNHVGNAGPLVQNAVGQIQQLLATAGGKRNLQDIVFNALGMNSIVSELQNLGTSVMGQFTSALTQLFFSGQQVLAQGQLILNNLIKDLQNHVGNAGPLVQNAVGQIQQLLANAAGGKRDLGDLLLNQLGLSSVVAEVQNLGSNAVAQLTSALTQLVFASKDIWNQAVAILKDLGQQLFSHAGNSQAIFQQHIQSLTNLIQSAAGKRASFSLNDIVMNALGFGQVVDQLQAAGSNVYNQLVSVASQFLFSGQQLFAQAKPIFAQLLKDLQNHVANAGPLVQAAVAQLTQVLSSSAGGKRDLTSVLLNTLGLGEVLSTIQAVGQQFYGQFIQFGTQLLFAGKDIWAQATAIFSQLLQDLKDHASNTTPYIQQAIGSLTALLANQGK